MKKKKPKLPLLSPSKAILQTAKGLYEAGIIDAITMHEFDALCLTPIKEMSSHEIKKLRLREKVSQPVLAAYLNTSVSAVKQWETGAKHPRGPSLKLLNLIARNGLKAVA